MKVAFYVLIAACLISGFSAADLSAFEENFDLESDFDETVIHHDDGVKILWPTTKEPNSSPSTTASTTHAPSSTTNAPSSTTNAPTTTTNAPTTTTNAPTTTTNAPTTTLKPTPTRPPRPTYPPRPTTTTHRPRPTTPPRPSSTSSRPSPPSLPIVKRPQIYNNRVNALKPFASNLVNVVLNKGGKQRTIQKNQIFYNIRNRPAPRLMNEEEPMF